MIDMKLTVVPKDQISVARSHLSRRAASGLPKIGVPIGKPSLAYSESSRIVLPKSARHASGNRSLWLLWLTRMLFGLISRIYKHFLCSVVLLIDPTSMNKSIPM